MPPVHPADRLLVIRRLAEARRRKEKKDPPGWDRFKPKYVLWLEQEKIGGYRNQGEATQKILNSDPVDGDYYLTEPGTVKRWIFQDGRWEPVKEI